MLVQFRIFQSNRWNYSRCCQYIRGQRPASFQGSNERDAAPGGATHSLSKIRKGIGAAPTGAKAKLNQINDLYMHLNPAQGKAR